jgi:hypothetical protein
MSSGCTKYENIRASNKNQKRWDIVHDLSFIYHGNLYEHNQASFVDVSKKLRSKAKSKDGLQKPYAHYGGSGCSKCALEVVY